MAGAACATGDVPSGAAGIGATGAGATGAGARIVAPGDPGHPVTGPAAGAVTDCGATRLCTCAGADAGSKNSTIAARLAAINPRQNPLNNRRPNCRPTTCRPTTCRPTM